MPTRLHGSLPSFPLIAPLPAETDAILDAEGAQPAEQGGDDQHSDIEGRELGIRLIPLVKDHRPTRQLPPTKARHKPSRIRRVAARSGLVQASPMPSASLPGCPVVLVPTHSAGDGNASHDPDEADGQQHPHQQLQERERIVTDPERTVGRPEQECAPETGARTAGDGDAKAEDNCKCFDQDVSDARLLSLSPIFTAPAARSPCGCPGRWRRCRRPGSPARRRAWSRPPSCGCR